MIRKDKKIIDLTSSNKHDDTKQDALSETQLAACDSGITSDKVATYDSYSTNKANISADNFDADGKSLLSGLVYPSGKYVDLTLGSSGSSYTAPANGWVTMQKRLGGTGVYELSISITKGDASYADAKIVPAGLGATNALKIFMPVPSGATFVITYNLTGNTDYFRFIYAEGEQ